MTIWPGDKWAEFTSLHEIGISRVEAKKRRRLSDVE